MREGARTDLSRGRAVLAEAPTEESIEVARALGLPGAPTASDYSDVFLFQLYPYASVHLGAEGMIGGEARDRIAGFWRAVGLTPPAEPDHLASLLGLYAALAERAAETEDEAEAVLLVQAKGALLAEHLVPWIFPFLARVTELSDGPIAAWAELLTSTLRAEIQAADGPDTSGAEPAPRSAHLAEAPGLPDPRVDGSDDFLAALLAPVRSGVILTRADLARLAVATDTGLRAGERRYALEHLLAQDAPQVLRLLAAECRRQAVGHEERAGAGSGGGAGARSHTSS